MRMRNKKKFLKNTVPNLLFAQPAADLKIWNFFAGLESCSNLTLELYRIPED